MLLSSLLDQQQQQLAAAAAAINIAVFLSFCLILWRGVIRCHLESKKPFGDDLPMPPKCHWFLGHVSQLEGNFRTRLKTLTKQYANEYGQTGFWMSSMPVVSVVHWKDARTVLNAEYARTRVPILQWHLSMFLGSRNLGLLNGREWKFHRSAVMRSFGTSAMAKSRQDVNEITSNLVQSLRKKIDATADDASKETCGSLGVSGGGGGEVELTIEPLMKMITIDVFGKSALSKDFQCSENLHLSQIAESFDFLGEELSRRLNNAKSLIDFFYFIPNDANRKHREARNVLRSMLLEVVQERKKLGSEDDKNDVLSNILNANAKIKEELDQDETVSDQMLTDILMTLLFAGYDTTSITLTYALYLLSQHPNVEKNCLEEIKNVGLDRPGDLNYCRAVLMETLRLHPPGNATIRTVEKPLELRGGFVVPAGANVFIPIYVIQRDEIAFPRPEDFRPDRWTKLNVSSQQWTDRRQEDDDYPSDIPTGNREAFFAFSAGPRSCPGYKFAMQEAVLALAGLVKELKFTAISGYKLRPVRIGIVQHPDDGIPMKITSRS